VEGLIGGDESSTEGDSAEVRGGIAPLPVGAVVAVVLARFMVLVGNLSAFCCFCPLLLFLQIFFFDSRWFYFLPVSLTLTLSIHFFLACCCCSRRLSFLLSFPLPNLSTFHSFFR
jgi:hypothetical protein